MNKSKFLILGIFVFLSFSFSNIVFGATTSSAQPPLAKAIKIASVNIHDASIIYQQDNILSISFTLSNGDGVQSGVHYGVKLVSVTSEGQFVTDEKVYDEAITLPENSSIKKEITYTAPSAISGKYTVLVTSSNENGFPFGVTVAGEISLSPTVQGLQILADSCLIQIDGQKDGNTYGLGKVLGIDPNQSLRLDCRILNSKDSIVSALPVFETKYSNAYGQTVEATGGDIAPIPLNSLENKSFSILLPKATKPQVYNISIAFKDGSNLSNTVNVRYVIKGTNATIANLSLDKDFYNKGDTAKLGLIYSSSISSDLSLKVMVENDRGQACAEPVVQTLPKVKTAPITEIPVTITEYCFNPHISATLSDNNGTILDQKSFAVETASSTRVTQLADMIPIMIVLALIFIIVLGYVYMKKNNKENAI